MTNFYKLPALLCLIILFYGCEQPGSPDFKTEQKVQTPLTINNTYQFLGTDQALVDTTSESFDSLFTVDGDGLVTLSQEQDFDFGSLDDAIPEIEVSPTNINSEVGTLELGNFTSSSGNAGEASFEDITGLDPSNYNSRDSIPDSPEPAPTTNIKLDTDRFESAILSQDGSLELTLSNDLGFDIDELTVALNAGSTELGSDSITSFDDDTEGSITITLDNGDNLEDLNLDVTPEWANKTLQREPDRLVVDDIAGNNLVASEVTAALPAQDFSTSGTTDIDDSDFEFTQAEHFIAIQEGELNISDILNEIPLSIENLEITFPDIRTDENGDGNYNTPIEINKSIPRSSGGTPGQTSDETIDLSDVRIFAEGNEISYDIRGTTEDTGSDIRTISENDEFTAAVEINDLELDRAEGIIAPRRIVINDDDLSEAETVTIDDLEEISEQLDGLEFINPELGIVYDTDLGVETSIIAAIYGTDPNGNEVYLHGKEGEETYVDESEIPSELTANGSTLNSDQLIRFPLEPSEDGSAVVRSAIFDTQRTNVDEFMNVLPTNVRFVGVADLNEDREEGFVQNPILFDPNLSVGLPIHIRSQSASFSDTTDADLSDLPDNEKSTKLKDASFTVNYTNGLPLDVDLKLLMLDENEEPIMELPESGEDPIAVNAASVDDDSRFVSDPTEEKTTFTLNSEQLDVLNNTREMVIEVSFNTTNQENVKLRAEDEITLSFKLNASIESEIN